MTSFSKHVFISGRVQGVGYRAWTVRQAQSLGLTGWVRNRRDGRVEALFCGEEGSVEKMLSACREGPSAARVESIEATPLDETHQTFRQRETV